MAAHRPFRNLQMEYVDLYLIHFPVSMRLPEAEGGQAPVLAKENLVEDGHGLAHLVIPSLQSLVIERIHLEKQVEDSIRE